MNKIKVLYRGESTRAKSGFGKYGREVLTRLAQNPNLEIAELAGFGCIEDDYDHVKGWKVYPSSVREGHPHHQAFVENPKNNFGFWRFDRCLLDFKPHFVFTISDPWNDDYVALSPLRKFFHFSYMPTVDSIPQQPQWLENFRDCDSIFTYSDWAIPYLKEITNGDIQPVCSPYPGTDLNIFKPLDKKALRAKYGLPEDAIIIGMISRNQRRKLFPELMKMFKIFLERYGNTEIGKKTYLYLHTSYPEPQGVGWDFPALLSELGIGSRVIFSYYCRESKQPLCINFQGSRTFSPFTHGPTSFFPNIAYGLTEPQLAEIINLFDLYIQYANCEGSGMGQIEAAACGVPIASTNYSAMADLVEKTGGIPLKCYLSRDPDLQADRAVLDNEDAANSIYKFLSLDKKYRERKSKQTREVAEKYFNWDRTAKIWSDHFENTQLTGLQGQWDAPAQLNDFNIPAVPPNLTNSQFIQFCSVFIAKQPELSVKHFGLEWLNKLNTGFAPEGHVKEREVVLDQFQAIGNNRIAWERARIGQLQLNPSEDWIDFAHSFK